MKYAELNRYMHYESYPGREELIPKYLSQRLQDRCTGNGDSSECPWWIHDKLKARTFVQQNGVQVPQLYEVLVPPITVQQVDSMPEYFVIKTTNYTAGNEGVMLLHRITNGVYHEAIRVRDYSTQQIVEEQNSLYCVLSRNHDMTDYRILSEEWVPDEEGRIVRPRDYKAVAYYGKIGFIWERIVAEDSVSFAKRIWDSNWVLLHTNLDMVGRYVIPGPSDNFKTQFVQTVNRLSLSLKCTMVRVDMYATNRGLVFGEFGLDFGSIRWPAGETFYIMYDWILNSYWMDARYRMVADGVVKHAALV